MASQVYTIARTEDTCDMFLDERGNIALVEGKDAYAQMINAKMRTVIGEVPLNMNLGLPYFTTVFDNKAYLPLWEAECVSMIEQLPFVRKVESFTCQIEGSVVKYRAEIRTDSGVIEANG